MAQAQSGTGKTAVFSIAIAEMIDPTNRNVQALILAHTRELAAQIQTVYYFFFLCFCEFAQ